MITVIYVAADSLPLLSLSSRSFDNSDSSDRRYRGCRRIRRYRFDRRDYRDRRDAVTVHIDVSPALCLHERGASSVGQRCPVGNCCKQSGEGIIRTSKLSQNQRMITITAERMPFGMVFIVELVLVGTGIGSFSKFVPVGTDSD